MSLMTSVAGTPARKPGEELIVRLTGGAARILRERCEAAPASAAGPVAQG